MSPLLSSVVEARNTHNAVGRYLPETYGEALFTSERPEYDVQTVLAAVSLYRKSWLRRCNQTRALSHHFVELFPDELACFGFPPPLHRDAHQISTGFGTLDHLRTRQNQQHDQRFLGTGHAFFTFHAPRRCEHDCSESVDADAWRSRDHLCCFTPKIFTTCKRACATVASTSLVFVVVMVCRAMRCSDPIGTLPAHTVRVGLLLLAEVSSQYLVHSSSPTAAASEVSAFVMLVEWV